MCYPCHRTSYLCIYIQFFYCRFIWKSYVNFSFIEFIFVMVKDIYLLTYGWWSPSCLWTKFEMAFVQNCTKFHPQVPIFIYIIFLRISQLQIGFPSLVLSILLSHWQLCRLQVYLFVWWSLLATRAVHREYVFRLSFSLCFLKSACKHLSDNILCYH